MPQTKEPVHVTITNLATDEIQVVPFNPPRLRHGVQVKWSKSQVLGQSHEEHHYTGTGNHTLPMQFYYDVDTPSSLESADDFRAFFNSLAYPVAEADSIIGHAPPDILVVWPRTINMICKLMSVGFDDEMFRTDGKVSRFKVNCKFEERRRSRLTSGTVRQVGLIRGGDDR